MGHNKKILGSEKPLASRAVTAEVGVTSVHLIADASQTPWSTKLQSRQSMILSTTWASPATPSKRGFMGTPPLFATRPRN